jgi:hypothetical protein
MIVSPIKLLLKSMEIMEYFYYFYTFEYKKLIIESNKDTTTIIKDEYNEFTLMNMDFIIPSINKDEIINYIVKILLFEQYKSISIFL